MARQARGKSMDPAKFRFFTPSSAACNERSCAVKMRFQGNPMTIANNGSANVWVIHLNDRLMSVLVFKAHRCCSAGAYDWHRK